MIDKITFKSKIHNVNKSQLVLELTGNYSELINKKLKEHISEVIYAEIKSYEQFKTNGQNRLFHSLLNKYYNSNMFDYSSFFAREPQNVAELKIDVKIRFNPASMIKIHNRADLLSLKETKGQFVEMHNKELYFIKSWAAFTVSQATKCIDQLITEMQQKGINIDSEYLEHKELKTKPEKEREIPLF